MRKVIFSGSAVLGALVALLGLLWALQGADLVHIKPVACVANCEPLTGPSATWLAAGIGAFLIGLAILTVSVRRLTRLHPITK